MLLLISKTTKIKSISKTAGLTESSDFIDGEFQGVTTVRKATVPLNKPDFQMAFKKKGDGDKNK